MDEARGDEETAGTRRAASDRLQTELREAGGLQVLRLEGRLPPGWAGALSLGLSRRGIAVVRGFGRKTPRGHWVAEIQMRAGSLGRDPRAVDYGALALSGSRDVGRVAIRLEGFRVERQTPGGPLLLEVAGEDRVGFLGSLLDSLAGLSLFPEEMEIDTLASLAHDRFQLRATGGRSPSDEAQRALGRLLRSMIPDEAAPAPNGAP